MTNEKLKRKHIYGSISSQTLFALRTSRISPGRHRAVCGVWSHIQHTPLGSRSLTERGLRHNTASVQLGSHPANIALISPVTERELLHNTASGQLESHTTTNALISPCKGIDLTDSNTSAPVCAKAPYLHIFVVCLFNSFKVWSHECSYRCAARNTIDGSLAESFNFVARIAIEPCWFDGHLWEKK